MMALVGTSNNPIETVELRVKCKQNNAQNISNTDYNKF